MDRHTDREFFPPGFLENGGNENKYSLDNPDILKRHTDRLVEVFRDDLIYDINGPDESTIYICGKDGLLAARTDQDGFRRLPELTEQRLLDIVVLDEERILVCGEGILLIGNHRDGFRQAANVSHELTFRRMATFGDKVYLAAPGADGIRGGLYSYDGKSLSEVETGLPREIGGLSSLSATDEMLLVVGHKEIVRFDGKTWDRIDYPGNATGGK